MENVAGGGNLANSAVRPTNVPAEQKDRGPQRASEVTQGETRSPTELSVASLAADAEEGKLRSLSNLQTVSESIDDAVEVLNQALSLKNTSAIIRRDEQLNRYLVTIKDKESGEIVREIPDEALIKFARNLQELRGILFDETT